MRPAGQQRAERVLQTLAAAAEAVQQREFLQQHGAWVEAHQQQLPPEVVAFWQQAQQVGRAGAGGEGSGDCCVVLHLSCACMVHLHLT